VYLSEAVLDYVVALVQGSREAADIALGASPRATLALVRSSQALAAIEGRSFVLPDDVKRLAVPVLAHRLILASQGRLHGRAAAQVVSELLARIPAPVEAATGLEG
jgi:MoxR-like ATPase